jgi:hypothetical protein
MYLGGHMYIYKLTGNYRRGYSKATAQATEKPATGLENEGW